MTVWTGSVERIYTHEGIVTIDVDYEDDPQMLKVRVSDTGIGIKEEDIGKLFGSFQRLEEDKNRNIEGTGLGLNITMRLVKMMDGTIDVDSKYGEGTTFTAKMKQTIVDRTPVGDFARNLLAMKKTKEYRPALIAPDARILVVDDNEMNLEVIVGLLKETRINVSTAESGQECIDILKERSFDIVFLDQMMPGMSGVKTLEKIKQQHLADNTPVIALTADAIVGARDNYIKEGFSDYLSKPVMYDALEAVIRKYLDDKKILNETQISQLEKNKSQAKKTIILAISESPEELRDIKSLLGEKYKGAYVKNIVDAEKYLAKKSTERES